MYDDGNMITFIMQNLPLGIDIIMKYEGFNEKSFADPITNARPYTIGYGTQYYPDGEPVGKDQLCTREKALEYLKYEVQEINTLLDNEIPDLHKNIKESLISFVHSIGWDPFLYSDILDAIDLEEWGIVTETMYRWIFDHDYQVISNLIYRRREEINLFLIGIQNKSLDFNGLLLLNAFMCYESLPNQIQAIKKLEQATPPIILAEFINTFKLPAFQQDEIMV